MVFFLLSSALYFLPYPLSSFPSVTSEISARIRTDYSAETGVVVAWALFACVLGVILYPKRPQQLVIAHRNRWESMALTITLVLLSLYTALTPEIYSATKADVLDATNRGHLLFYAVSTTGLVYSFLVGWRKEKINLALSLAGLGFILFIGHRSALALALLSIFYISFRNRSITQIRPLYIAIGLGLLFGLAVWKSIYKAVKSGLYDQALSNLASESLASSALVGLEQFVIFLHLDYVVNSDFQPLCSNIWLIPVSIIPFADQFVDAEGCTFTDQIQPLFFTEFSGGVGANIWAEFYSHLGYTGIPVLVLTLGLSVFVVEWIMNKVSSALLKSGFIIAIMHMVFYIQRKELFGAFISAKRAVIAALIVFFFATLLRLLLSKRRESTLQVHTPMHTRSLQLPTDGRSKPN